MNLYKKIFPKKNSLFIVIHVVSKKQANENVKIAFESGADGVFLINHSSGYESLIEIYREIKQQYPNFWIGLNLLDLSASAVLDYVPNNASGLWVDNIGLNEEHDCINYIAQKNWVQKQEKYQEMIYFGSIAFKYQKEVKQLDWVACLAKEYADVVVTSGDRTGSPPNLHKIKTIRKNIDHSPLAIASGITRRM